MGTNWFSNKVGDEKNVLSIHVVSGDDVVMVRARHLSHQASHTACPVSPRPAPSSEGGKKTPPLIQERLSSFLSRLPELVSSNRSVTV
ncbi:hypothetical protein E2C01_076633 [Portunus trituberculatus]|uniref:Uncharacterized protein n=1 Tax=Portunus trituberculatus TaxID=210409 RepID=A0A5B7I968_PORTR|nr:hypothetical protein [Portunus trituberculatus]